MKAWKSRAKGIISGVVLVIFGWLRLKVGIDVVVTSRMQPMFSFGLIAGGLVLIGASLLPDSLVARMTELKERKL